MSLLIFYLLLALSVSFLCSIAEAVLLSVRPSFIELLEQKGSKSAITFKHFQHNLDRPLSAILTANTIAHTIGAAGVGAKAAQLFGDDFLGVISAILTLLILVFSEIIPKTLGALYWQQLAPLVGMIILWMIYLLFPFVWLSEKLTRLISGTSDSVFTFSRDEIKAMANIGKKEGILDTKEHTILSNLMKLKQITVNDIMTPRPVIHSVMEDLTVQEFFTSHADEPFSRIPVRSPNADEFTGYILRNDLLLAQAHDNFDQRLTEFKRDILFVSKQLNISEAFDKLMSNQSHIALVVDEYGSIHGLVTQEDIVESLFGLEITDELDKVEDMQLLAQNRWRKRMGEMGNDPKP